MPSYFCSNIQSRPAGTSSAMVAYIGSGPLMGSSLSGTKTPRRLPRRFHPTVRAGSRRLDDVAGLRSLLALHDLEFHAIALGQGLEAVSLDGAEVDEHVRA